MAGRGPSVTTDRNAEEEGGKAAGVSDAAVREKTGKTWHQWFAILDRAKASTMTHKDIAAYLRDRRGVPPWWAQTVTVGYERARGLREKHQSASGYSAGVSRTIRAPVEALYGAWANDRTRVCWLGDGDLRVRTSTPSKSIRADWGRGESRVDVSFNAVGQGKSRVTVDHNRLNRNVEVARMKAFWSAALNRLKERLEG
jgi:hypothetical protein